MKKLVNVWVALIFVLAFTGCSSSGISNRAIVKAILIDTENDKYKVSLVTLNCEPSSQIAEIKEIASVSTGTSDNLNTAILNAEKKQSKSAFYAQNELLLINLNAVNKFNEITGYFLSENCARPGMTVFLTETNESSLKENEKNLPKFINQIQSINVMNNPFVAARIYDVTMQNNSYSAMLPILKIDENNGSYIVDNMGLVANNNMTSTISDNYLAISIMLSKHSDVINMTTDEFNFKATALKLSNEVKNGELTCIITGNIKHFELLNESNNKAAKEIETEINQYLSSQCSAIYNQYLKESNILKLNWWLEMYGANINANVNFISKLIL